MARTTPALVKAIADVDDVEVPDLSPFIDSANILIEKHVATAKNSDGTAYYTSTELEMIERWLAAHFYHIRVPQASSEGVSGINESFQHSVSLGLDQTRYGQMAQDLDIAGGLRRLKQGSTRAGRVTWLGTPKPTGY